MIRYLNLPNDPLVAMNATPAPVGNPDRRLNQSPLFTAADSESGLPQARGNEAPASGAPEGIGQRATVDDETSQAIQGPDAVRTPKMLIFNFMFFGGSSTGEVTGISIG